MSIQQYPVFVVKSAIDLPDPDMPPGRLHHAIFVETGPDGSGVCHEVTGDITSRSGMKYETRKTEKPADLETFHSQKALGYTSSDTYPELWDLTLKSLPTPPQQKAANPNRQGKVEPFKEKLGDYSYLFYEAGDERRPLWKCTEWTERLAIPELIKRGLLRPEP